MPIRLRRAASAAVLLAALASQPLLPAFAQEPAPADPSAAAAPDAPAVDAPAPDAPVVVDPNTVLLKIGTETVTRADLDKLVEQLPPQYRAAPLDQLWPMLADNMVNRKLMAAAGEKAGLAEGEAVAAAVERARESAIGEAYMEQVIDKELTEDKLKAEYDAWVKENPPEEEVHARHILVDTKEEADKIIADLKAGGDFNALASQSKDSSNAASGGDLGWFTRETMVKPFADAAFALEPGAVTQEPVETQFGFHVIKLEERRQSAPESFETKKEELRNEMAGTVLEKEVAGLKEQTPVEMFNLDGTPMEMPEMPE